MAAVLATPFALGCGAPTREAPSPRAENHAEQPHPDAPCQCRWVHLPYLVEFAPRSSELGPNEDRILRDLVLTIDDRTDFVQLRVEGHSATCPEELHDRPLSERRAAAVAERLIELGMDPTTVTTVGYGTDQPRKATKERMVPCGPDEQRAGVRDSERRVELSILVCRRTIGAERVGCAPDIPLLPDDR